MTNPGLDLTALRALRAPQHDLPTLHARIENHLDQHDGFLAFSAGKDSLVTLHLARQVDPNIPVAFYDSGNEWPETYTYLADLSDRWNLNLHVIPARPTALEILVATGTWDHHATSGPVPDLHHTLITEPAAHAHDTFGPGQLWGVRESESNARAALFARALADECRRTCHGCCADQRSARATHGGVLHRNDGTIAYSPVWDWRDEAIWNHIARYQLPLNPVYAKLASLGAPSHALRISTVIDASHLEAGRITWIQRGWPALFADLCTVLPRLREYV